MVLPGAARGQFKNFVTVGFFAGMRLGEISALKWEDVDLTNNKILVRRAINSFGKEDTTKTGAERLIDILPPVAQALKDQLARTGKFRSYVFYRNGGFIPFVYFQYWWFKTLRELGIKREVMYAMRHSFASIMISEGEDILWVSQMLGHSNLSTTFRSYAKFIKQEVKRARFLDDYLHSNLHTR
ncbi:MAG: site-specific integrase [Helicobacteraceae bacterium]